MIKVFQNGFHRRAHLSVSWENIMREAAAKHIEEVPQWGVERPHGGLGRVECKCEALSLEEPKEMSNSIVGLGIAGMSWRTSWWPWCCGRGSPAAATANLIQTEKILMKHKLRSTEATKEQNIKNWLPKINLFGWEGQSLANLSTSCLISASAPLQLEPS